MITEDYCSFEICKLLAEKGFNVCTKAFYKKKDQILHFNTCALAYYAIPNELPAPTHQMAIKWLREEKDIHVEVCISVLAKNLAKYTANIFYKKHKDDSMYLGIHLNGPYSKYEEGIEAAIKYVLENLI